MSRTTRRITIALGFALGLCTVALIVMAGTCAGEKIVHELNRQSAQ